MNDLFFFDYFIVGNFILKKLVRCIYLFTYLILVRSINSHLTIRNYKDFKFFSLKIILGANVKATDQKGPTIIHYACRQSFIGLFDYMGSGSALLNF